MTRRKYIDLTGHGQANQDKSIRITNRGERGTS